MESAGKSLDDRELARAMKERGLGTPATRAGIIETLIKREYIERRGRVFHATRKGIALIERVHEKLRSPEMTGEWEAKLRSIEASKNGEAEGLFRSFMSAIEDYVGEVVGLTFQSAGTPGKTAQSVRPRPTAGKKTAPARSETQAQLSLAGARGTESESVGSEVARTARKPRPKRSGDLTATLEQCFGHGEFRPYQKRICEHVVAGNDALVVMPTGSGKSLCYQLPGLVRGGTTLVVSPLIALMEDQVAKLQASGFAAERIHSGRDRLDQRRVSRAYLDGELDFLFIAPERLGVPRFPEMLAKRLPVLVAIDEAHCISHWGHDFRPDYRMLGERLPILRPAPVIALTATATPIVQNDISELLGLESSGTGQRFIHGFRRDNIAIEVAERKPKTRGDATADLLSDPRRRPAIVYARTRKEAEKLARELGDITSAAAYHAGMPARRRNSVQETFLADELEIVVATIAFGMGIDKPNVRTVVHTALPGTLEGYYQEIGRAGRDGLPSRAVLFYSWADRRTHEFFHKKNYPEPIELQTLYRALGDEPVSSFELLQKLRMDEEIFEQALDKLWIHGGAVVTPDERVSRGTGSWQRPYLAQREHKLAQLEQITRFAESHTCRMLHLVQHFGDLEDSGEPCGICGICDEEHALANRTRPPDTEDRRHLEAIVESLLARDRQGTGQLFKSLQARYGSVDRGEYEELLRGLVRAGVVRVEQDSFVKNGQTIHFQRAALALRRAMEGIDKVRLPVAVKARSTPSAKRKRSKAGGKRGRATGKSADRGPALSGTETEMVAALKEWRLHEAKRRKIPAFRVLPNRTLAALARARPADEDELAAVSGIGPTTIKRYGDRLIALLGASRV